jgi:CRISPR/Cas system endoribonuclease Cas6 (RAMP superfamily)
MNTDQNWQIRQKEFEARRKFATLSPVIAESLKTAVDTLSQKERHELACYLTKLELQNDADYWKTIRERTNSGHTRRYAPVPENQHQP